MIRDHSLDRLDDLIRARSILEHPFYVAWQKGDLSRDEIATYARIYYPHVAAFPTHLEMARTHAANPFAQDELARNLEDELSRPAPHPELWLDFAEEVGLDRVHVMESTPHPAAQRMIDTLRKWASGSTIGALSALYAYESQQPEVSQSKRDGLRTHYGLATPKGLAYFTVHATLDREHRAGERNALAKCLEQEPGSQDMILAATDTLNAYWDLLDGVCAATGIAIQGAE